MKTVLFVGAGRHQRRAILRAQELGLRVIAVDRNAEAAGRQRPTRPVVDTSTSTVVDVARRHGVDGALTVSADGPASSRRSQRSSGCPGSAERPRT
jgi:D-arabinose 1-dehydrogenase-like Zn-dependent alcohol dehydrogenase